MSQRGWNTGPVARIRIRSAALLALAALTLHELRYLAGYGSTAQDALAEQGHGYLSTAAPIAGLLVGLALVELLLELMHARRVPGRAAAASGFGVRWVVGALALLIMYATQELLEGALLAGHPSGVTGVLGHGGWVAIGLAVVLGAAVAAFLRGADLLVGWYARSRTTTHRRPHDAWRPVQVALPRLAPLAARAAGRAPPPLLSS